MPANLVLRSTSGGTTNTVKGAPLTNAEIDANFINLDVEIDTKAPINNPTFTGTVGGISKSAVGLGNVDNTSDANKPISSATQTALNGKTPLNGTGATGTWSISISGAAGSVTNGMTTVGAQTVTGTKTFTQNSDTIAAASSSAIEIAANQATAAAYLKFNRPSSPSTPAAFFGLDADNVLKVGGGFYGNVSHTILHTGNTTIATAATANSVAQRDASGNITANYVIAAADVVSDTPNRIAVDTLAAAGKMRWQTLQTFKRKLESGLTSNSVVNETTVLQCGYIYNISTTTATSVKLPSFNDTDIGDSIKIYNPTLSWALYFLTITPQANTKIMGLAEQLICDVNVGGITLTCVSKDTYTNWSVT